ncbi:MAG: hypothetical protein WC623_22500 [Pedobacter sp.]|uniref:hypothetical protein n=1 Tax=Pedobacter sp. TaxID=1411316 RepID=UPI003563DDA8
MTQIGKFAHMFYEINKDRVILDIVEQYENHPDVHISKEFSTNLTGFWNFVIDAVIEAKEDCFVTIENEEGDITPNGINKAKAKLEVLRNLEKALTPLVSEYREKIEE